MDSLLNRQLEPVHFMESSHQLVHSTQHECRQQLNKFPTAVLNKFKSHGKKKRRGTRRSSIIVIEITSNSSSTTNISPPVTMSTASSSLQSMVGPSQSRMKRTRRSSPKQASEYWLKSKQAKLEYDNRYTAMWKGQGQRQYRWNSTLKTPFGIRAVALLWLRVFRWAVAAHQRSTPEDRKKCEAQLKTPR